MEKKKIYIRPKIDIAKIGCFKLMRSTEINEYPDADAKHFDRFEWDDDYDDSGQQEDYSYSLPKQRSLWDE